MRRTIGIAVAAALTALASAAGAGAQAGEPTCASVLGIANHGQHVVGDYVTGTGHDNLGWPPNGRSVGEAVAGSGAAVPGGPGPGFHFPNGVAPGASFCNAQSQSPGFHVGG